MGCFAWWQWEARLLHDQPVLFQPPVRLHNEKGGTFQLCAALGCGMGCDCTLSNVQPLGATPPVDCSRSNSLSCTPRGPGSTRQMPQAPAPVPELNLMPSPCTGSIAAAMNCVWTLRNFGSFVMPEDELKAKNSRPWHMRARAASTERPVGVTLASQKKCTPTHARPRVRVGCYQCTRARRP